MGIQKDALFAYFLFLTDKAQENLSMKHFFFFSDRSPDTGDYRLMYLTASYSELFIFFCKKGEMVLPTLSKHDFYFLGESEQYFLIYLSNMLHFRTVLIHVRGVLN